jgi:hypothetical protein
LDFPEENEDLQCLLFLCSSGEERSLDAGKKVVPEAEGGSRGGGSRTGKRRRRIKWCAGRIWSTLRN